jgi:hypothetical protein
MSEIDPQFERGTDDKLTRAMRKLAATSQQGASAEVGAGLATAFRRHHTRRRRIRYASIAGLVACLALVAGVISLRWQSHLSSVAQGRTNQIHQTPAPVNEAAANPSSASANAPEAIAATLPIRASLRSVRKSAQPKTTPTTYSRQFLALPGYDPAVPADELHVVRVRMSSSTLWQMGAPVNPDGVGRRVMADFVVSQDGTPYAVRLVQ